MKTWLILFEGDLRPFSVQAENEVEAAMLAARHVPEGSLPVYVLVREFTHFKKVLVKKP